jgi:hypothetical protein
MNGSVSIESAVGVTIKFILNITFEVCDQPVAADIALQPIPATTSTQPSKPHNSAENTTPLPCQFSDLMYNLRGYL